MTRWALGRFVRRIAIASLPVLGAGACRHDSPAPEDASVLVDAGADQAVPLDAAVACQQLPNDSCYWFALVDASWPADMMDYHTWSPDAGEVADPCAPCNFPSHSDLVCGACLTSTTQCGATYTCIVVDCTIQCPSGRRPEGLAPAWTAAAEDAGAWIARMAHLEAASIPAFAHLACELAAHGAPERLIAGARRALVDEQRHAHMMGDLARAAGAPVPRVEVEPVAIRSLEEIAMENAVEGCVRESFGALLAAEHARQTRDPILAGVLRSVAVDEARHGELAWAVDAWVRPRLSPAARRRVEQARWAELRAVLASIGVALA
jgi:hypothetical protein